MKRMSKYQHENVRILLMLGAMRIMRAFLLMQMLVLALMVSGCTASKPSHPEPLTTPIQPSRPSFETSPTIIAEDFLAQFVSIFFGPFSDEPAILVNEEAWDYRRGSFHYFLDGHGNVISDVPFIQVVDGTGIWGIEEAYYLALARRFRLFTIYGSSEPLVIGIQYETFDFTGGDYALYEIISNGNEFLRLGSMIPARHFGAGYDAVSVSPFINESGDIIAYLISDGGLFFAINNEGDFEFIASINAHWQSEDGDTIIISVEDEDGSWHFEQFTQEEFEELLATEQMQSFFPDFPDGNFVPMIRMYDLEQKLTTAITERLRGTFPVVVQGD